MAKYTSNFGFTKPDVNEFYNVNVQNENWDKLDEELTKITNPEVVSITLSKSNWVGTVAPYTYTIPGYEGKTVEVVEDVNMTAEQLETIENAKIKGDPRSEENILYAFGDKPAIDVPVLLLVR